MAACATSQAVPCRYSGTGVVIRPGRPALARRPGGVLIQPEMSSFARTPRQALSAATCRLRPTDPLSRHRMPEPSGDGVMAWKRLLARFKLHTSSTQKHGEHLIVTNEKTQLDQLCFTEMLAQSIPGTLCEIPLDV